jgi:hypothetical protein
MKEFLKTTIVGGVLFLLPVALVLMVLNHALQLAEKVVRPISHSLNSDHTIAGFEIVTALTVLLLVIISFAAGIVARRVAADVSAGGSRARFSAISAVPACEKHARRPCADRRRARPEAGIDQLRRRVADGLPAVDCWSPLRMAGSPCSPAPQSAMISTVSWWPAARTGRSANMME